MELSKDRKYRLEVLFAKNEKENVIFMTSADQAFFNKNAATSAAQYHADQKVDTYNRREFLTEDTASDEDTNGNPTGAGSSPASDEAKAALKDARASYKMLFNKKAGNQWNVATIDQKMADEKVRLAAEEKPTPNPSKEGNAPADEVVLTEADLPKESDLKADTQKWMTDNKIPFEEKDNEPVLIEKVNKWFAEKQ